LKVSASKSATSPSCKTLAVRLTERTNRKIENMDDKSQFFIPYPKYEDVFYDDIENHKKYFLPICSINLKFMFPDRDEWFHFISVKEIYEGCVGENTFDFHTEYTKEDMFGFDIIDGKYKFDASWDYFYINHKGKQEINLQTIEEFDGQTFSTVDFERWIANKNCSEKLKNELKKISKFHNQPDKNEVYNQIIKRLKNEFSISHFEELEKAYQENTNSYEVGKKYFEKYGRIFSKTLNWENISLETLEELEAKDRMQYPDYKKEYPEYFGLIEDVKHQSIDVKAMMKEHNISVEEMDTFEDTNLLEVPKDNNNKVFEYIGYLTGYNFQKNGADALYLFQNQEMKKAVICLEYS
jgi:hypothetical protein